MSAPMAKTEQQVFEIKLKIDEDVYGEMRTHLLLREMTGEAGGILDAVLLRIIQSIEKGNTECLLRRKKP